jgi:hypothetical protein
MAIVLREEDIRAVPYFSAIGLYPALPIVVAREVARYDYSPGLVVGIIYCVYAVPCLVTQTRPWPILARLAAIPAGLLSAVPLYPLSAWLLGVLRFDDSDPRFRILALAMATMPSVMVIMFRSGLFVKRAN